MLMELGLLTIGLLAAGMVAALFFCRAELGPKEVQEFARASRYTGLTEQVKQVRFW